MTFKELNEKFGSALVETEWHRASGGGWVQNTARVVDESHIQDDAIVSGNARVSGNAGVFGGRWEQSPLFIVGSRYSLTNAKPGHIQIGCECHTFSEWKKVGPAIAEREKFTPEQIAEYTAYVNLFSQIGK